MATQLKFTSWITHRILKTPENPRHKAESARRLTQSAYTDDHSESSASVSRALHTKPTCSLNTACCETAEAQSSITSLQATPSSPGTHDWGASQPAARWQLPQLKDDIFPPTTPSTHISYLPFLSSDAEGIKPSLCFAICAPTATLNLIPLLLYVITTQQHTSPPAASTS